MHVREGQAMTKSDDDLFDMPVKKRRGGTGGRKGAPDENGIFRADNGRPYVIPPGMQPWQEKSYSRMTTFIKAVEDTFALNQWANRMTAVGLSMRDDLLALVAASRENDEALNRLVTDAQEHAGSRSAAQRGNALHALCRQHDAGRLDVDSIPTVLRPDVYAWHEATREFVWSWREHPVVVDSLECHGTPDGLAIIPPGIVPGYATPPGKLTVVDLKTGKRENVVKYGGPSHSMQLAGYAHGMVYHDPDVHECRACGAPRGMRERVEIDRETGVVIAMQAGTATVEFMTVDLTIGRAGLSLAKAVKEWRTIAKTAQRLAGALTPDDFDFDPAEILTPRAIAPNLRELPAIEG